MKKIRINARNYETNAHDLRDLRSEFALLSADAITIYRGFATDDNIELQDGDNVIFIKKGEIPSGELLRETMSARNSPEINTALNSAKVAVVGLGGLGSSVAIALARVGVANLKIVDFDVVDPSNLNRQQYFVEDIGKHKATALQGIISKINPFVRVEALNVKLDENNVCEILSDCDIVAECFDVVEAKAMLINSIKNKIIVASSGMAGYGASDEIKTTKFANNLYVCGDLKSAAAIGRGLMAPRVGICAMHQANLILELIIKKEKNG